MPTSSTPPSYLEVDAHANSPNSSPLISGAGPSTAPHLPSPTSPSWKNIFRLGGASSRKPGRSKSTLTLNTEFAAAAAANGDMSMSLNSARYPTSAYPSVSSKQSNSPPRAGDVMNGNGGGAGEIEAASMMQTSGTSSTLTPSSSVSFNTSLSNRYSSNSTGTLSSESGFGIAISGGGQNHNTQSHPNQNGSVVNGHSNSLQASSTTTARGRRPSRSETHPNTPAHSSFSNYQANGSASGMLPTPSSSMGRDRTKSIKSMKSDKYRMTGLGQPTTPLTPVESSSPLPAPDTTSPKTPSKGGMGRFIRRVASAPNAKGFFSLSKHNRERDHGQPSPGLRTPGSMRNFGFLSPTGTGTGRTSPVPEVPPVPGSANGNTQRVSQGTDSLDTSSSGSSHRRNLYPHQTHTNHGPNSSPPPAYHAPGSLSAQPTPTLSHSQSVQQLHAPKPQVGALLSPPKGTRAQRALSAASGPAPFLGKGSGNGKEVQRIGLLSTTPVPVGVGADGQARAPFRRTYSSNSIKVRRVEVDASSFQKIKLLGRGDVGKVYLVREKKTGKLYAMKGAQSSLSLTDVHQS